MPDNWYSRSIIDKQREYSDLVTQNDQLTQQKKQLQIDIQTNTENLKKMREQLSKDESINTKRRKEMEDEINSRQARIDKLKRELANLTEIQKYITQQMGIRGSSEYWSQTEGSDNTSLTTFNQQLKTVNSALTDLNTVQTNALSKQNEVKNIVDSEAHRLENKKTQIDQAVENQKHIIFANDNTRKIQGAYLKIIITLVITLGIIWVIRVVNRYFGKFIPEFITNFMYIITISIGCIIIFNYYLAIISRDPSNFDELKLDPPSPLATPTADPYAKYLNKNLLAYNICFGEKCCSNPDTVWNEEKGVCTKKDISTDIIPTSTITPTSTSTITPTPTSTIQAFTNKQTIPYSEAYDTYSIY